jgi:hypothetical protein
MLRALPIVTSLLMAACGDPSQVYPGAPVLRPGECYQRGGGERHVDGDPTGERLFRDGCPRGQVFLGTVDLGYPVICCR